MLGPDGTCCEQLTQMFLYLFIYGRWYWSKSLLEGSSVDQINPKLYIGVSYVLIIFGKDGLISIDKIHSTL